MSYAKKGRGSDVYLYRGLGASAPHAVLVRNQADAEALTEHATILVCHECLLMPEITAADREWDREHYTTDSPQEMLAHMDRHVSLGHMVPAVAFSRLRAELS